MLLAVAHADTALFDQRLLLFHHRLDLASCRTRYAERFSVTLLSFFAIHLTNLLRLKPNIKRLVLELGGARVLYLVNQHSGVAKFGTPDRAFGRQVLAGEDLQNHIVLLTVKVLVRRALNRCRLVRRDFLLRDH